MFSYKSIWRIYFDDQQQDRGAFLLLFCLFLFVAITMLAMVIDQSRESLALETIQRAADASALAAVRQLDSTQQGWNNARRAAVLALKSNPVHGARSGFENLRLADDAPSGPWLNSSTHTTTTGTAGGITFTVERGAIWFDNSLKDGLGDYVFRSLESDVDGFVQNSKWNGFVNTYLIANAVRTTVRLDRLPAYLGAVIGFDSFNDLERSAIAVSNAELEFEVAPLAIPYCQLLLDSNVHTNDSRHLIEEYNSDEQQRRELVFTEADPKRNLRDWNNIPQNQLDARLSRREGLTRFESFIRRPYVMYDGDSICSPQAIQGPAPSCKHVPLYGTIGQPATRSGTVTQPGEVAALFARAMNPNENARIKANLGAFFAPLEELSNNTGDVATASSELDRFINSGQRTFAQTFFWVENGQIKTRRNFPFIRTLRPPRWEDDPERRPFMINNHTGEHDTMFDLRLGWPTQFNIDGAQQATWIRMILDHQGNDKRRKNTRPPATWTNPLCHTDSNAIVANDPNQRVRRVRAMVIAPGNPEFDYCDFGALFSGNQQHAAPTITDSLPTIVGSVEVDLFDHHLTEFSKNARFVNEMNSANLKRPKDYEGPFRRVITPHYPGVISDAVDRHPGELDVASNQIFEAIADRVSDYKPLYEQCFGEAEKDEQGNIVADFDSPCAGKADEVARDLPQLDELDIFPDAYFECFDVDFLNTQLLQVDGSLWACLNHGACNDKNKSKTGSFNKLFNTINKILTGKKNIPARPFAHCLNQFRVGWSDPANPASYEELKPLRADRGCGGVRGRMVHDPNNKKVWATGSSHIAASPALINVADG